MGINVENELIPGLVSTWAEPGQSEPTYLGKYIVPKSFLAYFTFKDKAPKDYWQVLFTISVSDLGTPTLNSLTIEPFPDRWKIKLVEQHRFDLLELALKVVVKTRTPAYMLKEEYSLETVALMRAIMQVIPDINPQVLEELPPEFVRYWTGRNEPLNAKEIKTLLKEIDTRLRQRITPEFLQRIADIYTKAVNEGKNPIKEIMDSERVQHSTASQWATKCRQPAYGYLPPTKPGKVTVKKQTKQKGKK